MIPKISKESHGGIVMEEWRWDGSIWDFAETIQWALVFRQLGKDRPAGWSEMVSDPKMIEQKANEYGITLRAVTDEICVSERL